MTSGDVAAGHGAARAAAQELVEKCRARGWTIGTAESLTAGLVSATIADVPGCSDVLHGGVVAYTAQVKDTVLGVHDQAAGVVSASVAEQMARGARQLLSCDLMLATTGVAGPASHAGEPVGSVWLAVATPAAVVSEHLALQGGRSAIRQEATWAVLALALRVLGAEYPQ